MRDILESGPVWLTDINGKLLLRNIRNYSGPIHLSFSIIYSFLQCPLKYALKYLYHIKEPKLVHESSKFGRAIHASVETIIEEIEKEAPEELSTPTPEVKKEIIKKAIKKFETSFGKELTPVVRQEAITKIKDQENSSRIEKRSLVEKVAKEAKIKVAPPVKISVKTEVHSSIIVKFDDIEVKFFYSIDKIIKEGDRVSIYELKSASARHPHRDRISSQLAFYLWAYEKEHGVRPLIGKCVQIGSDEVLFEMQPSQDQNIIIEEFIQHIARLLLNNTYLEPKPGKKCANCEASHFCPAALGIQNEDIEKRKDLISDQVKKNLYSPRSQIAIQAESSPLKSDHTKSHQKPADHKYASSSKHTPILLVKHFGQCMTKSMNQMVSNSTPPTEISTKQV